MIMIIQFSGIYYRAGLTAQVLIMKSTRKANTIKTSTNTQERKHQTNRKKQYDNSKIIIIIIIIIINAFLFGPWKYMAVEVKRHPFSISTLERSERLILFRAKDPTCSLTRRLGGLQSRFGAFGKNTSLLSLPVGEPQ